MRISARRLLTIFVLSPAVLLLTGLVSHRLLLERLHSTTLDHLTIPATTIRVGRSPLYNASDSLEKQFLNLHHNLHPLRPINDHVKSELQQCRLKPNPITQHVRLNQIQIQNISMIPSTFVGLVETHSLYSKRFFNPAIIPLPHDLESVKSPKSTAQYLLLARMVTTGLHQESLVCLAETCASKGDTSGAKHIRKCNGNDTSLLGSNGGMRCLTEPDRLHIPPTPARRCTGTWSVFPDIPGFHDPRVFWDGQGSALVEINSGSQYGCVGLWLQDLSSVYQPLKEVLMKSHKQYMRSEEANEVGENKMDVDLGFLGPQVQFPRLTEITRNPRKSRNEVEKNWVLFFPNEDEIWVQYDLMGQIEKGKEKEAQSLGEDLTQATNLTTLQEQIDDISVLRMRLIANTTAQPIPKNVSFSTENDQLMGVLQKRDGTALQPSADMKSSVQSSTTSNFLASTKMFSYSSTQPRLSIKGGRTLAQLSPPNGHTTSNLTHPHESSCFPLHSHKHTHDLLDNTGHWHQGTNSIRLVFCARSQFNSRTCHTTVDDTDTSTMTTHRYESLLIFQGLVLHMSIIHRKFSNVWDLPMRYERHLILWEARKPFRMIGVSKWPVLFEREMARPWSWRENVENNQKTSNIKKDINKLMSEEGRVKINLSNEDRGSDGWQDGEQEEGEDRYYFTYTPSLSYAFRPTNLADRKTVYQKGHANLGSGFLDDDLVIGIGMDDVAMGFVKVTVKEVLQCFRICGAE